jgi:vancomycin resistance protein YoaR
VDTAALLDERITVKVAGAAVPLRRADLGFIVDETAAKTESRSPLSIDRERAAAAIADLKSHHDQAATEASLDLEQRTIRADQPGRGIDVYGSLAALSVAARTGATEVELVTVELPARTRAADLGIDDISTVIGHWSTKFSVSDRERVFNLKLAASKLNGYVLQPGVEFSFNDVVGERTEKQGYKVAHVISAGEMVDGLAGGTCQISTTLFAASFFAGLDIVSQTPHSRPSVYASLGLDATVVYPTTDLKLKNSFDFPVVIHYKVAAGEAVVELLGKERPYDKVTFERTITSRTPYTSEERLDDTIIADQTSLDQPGFDGYRISRVRRMFKDGVEVKTEKASVGYRPVTEYVRRGTSTDPNAKPASTAVPKMPSVPHGGVEVITQ